MRSIFSALTRKRCLNANHVPTTTPAGQQPDSRLSLSGLPTFAKEGAGADDAEANPQPVDDAAEQCDNLVTEERREGDDEEDGDRYEPASRQVTDFFGERPQCL